MRIAGDETRICIVSCGCLLPGAESPQKFWKVLRRGENLIRRLPDSRWPTAIHVTQNRGSETSCTANAGFVDEAVIDSAAARLGLDRKTDNRLHVMALEAARQALDGIDSPVFHGPRAAVFLGCMDVDEKLGMENFIAHNGARIKKHVLSTCGGQSDAVWRTIHDLLESWTNTGETFRRHRLPTSVIAGIRERWGLAGVSGIVDAACASSLAAVASGAHALLSGDADFALVGGMESNIGPDTFALFNIISALAPERCLPLDTRSQGISQGEGAVVFALERFADANKHGHEVLAFIDGHGAASDGKSSSLFAPTASGQQLAFARAWDGLDPSTAAYIECHATGTEVGDRTEVEAVAGFFGSRPLPIGSVKAITGHTKGAAGAVSLLKALLSFEHGEIPPSPYCKKPISRGDGPFVNQKAHRLNDPNARIGISSFGFGGINHHLVVAPPTQKSLDRPSGTNLQPKISSGQVVKISSTEVEIGTIRSSPRLPELRIAPTSLEQIDELQLTALVSVASLIDEIGLDLTRIDRDNIATISASVTGLQGVMRLVHRVRYAEIAHALRSFPEELRETVLKDRDALPKLSEATPPGVLNNVVAGRIQNCFDFRGPGFNVDADEASEGFALYLAHRMLGRSPGLVFVVAAQEVFDEESRLVLQSGVRCTLLASEEIAWEYGLPIEALVKGVAHAG